MLSRKAEKHADAKSRWLPRAVGRQTEKIALAPRYGRLTQVISGIGNASPASAHASSPSRVTTSRRSRMGQPLLKLQRLYGNRYVQRLLALSRRAGGDADVDPEVERAIQQARGGGQTLDRGVRAQMEPALGADFSDVQVHADAQADRLSRALNARAFTTGQDIFFQQGAYNPGSSSGRELLAHELTHVVQQNGNEVQCKLTVGQPDDHYEQEADRVTRAAMQYEQRVESDDRVRRQVEEEDEEEDESIRTKVEDLRIQRQAEGEKEEPVQTKRQDAWAQRQAREEEEEEEEPIQTKMEDLRVQRQAEEEEAEPVQTKVEEVHVQRQVEGENEEEPIQFREATAPIQQNLSRTYLGRRFAEPRLLDAALQGDQRVILRDSTGLPSRNPVLEAVRVLKGSPRLRSPKTSLDAQLSRAANLLTEEKVLGVFQEERERTGFWRQLGESLELFTSTYGKGAIGEPAFNDVDSNFPLEKQAFASVFGACPSDWIEAVTDENWGVFYSAAYLLLSIAKREKRGRTQDDQQRIGIAVYHGGFESVSNAQTAAAKRLGKAPEYLTWSEIAVELRKTAGGRDIANYVEDVVRYKHPHPGFSFTFECYAQVLGKTQFHVGDHSIVSVTSFAEYKPDPSRLPAKDKPPSTYYIVLGGKKALYRVGQEQIYTWENVQRGTHWLRIYNRHARGNILLTGRGKVKVRRF